MDLAKTIIQRGLEAATRAVGERDPAGALNVAKTAVTATRIVGNLTNVARQAADAVRDAIETPNDTSSGQPPSPPRDPIDELGAQVQAKPEDNGLAILFASARAAYRAEVTAGGGDPDAINEAIAKATGAVRSTLPAIINKTGVLVERAAPPGADVFKRFGRGLSGTLTGSDVAAEISRVDTWKGMVGGTSKVSYLGILLRRMGTPDVGVFQALDAFSNHNAERNKALAKICEHIGEMPVNAETAIATLSGFQLTNGKPDYGERRTALRTLTPSLLKDDVPKVLKGYCDDEKERLAALRVVAEFFSSITAVEMVELLKVFDRTSRGKARTILEPKLSDRENVQLLDDLFEPKKRIADLPELKQVRGAIGTFMTAFSQAAKEQ